MKKLLLLLTLLCTVFSTVFADVVTIGDDASTSYSLYLPLRSYYNYSYSQQIVYADEIGTAGTISSLSLNMKSDAGSTTRSIEIYMLEVDKDEFASTSDWVVVSADDLVYSGQIALTATAEDFVFDLDNPFSYGGSDNLLIVFRDVTGGFSGSYNTGAQALVSGSSTDPYLALYAYRDSPGAYDITNPNATGTRSSQRNVITLDIEASSGPVCKKPSLLEASEISENEATLSWDGESGFFTVAYKAASADEWITVLESSPLTTTVLSDLQSNTAYTARVIGVCGEQVSGEKTISFRTACGIYSVATSGAYEEDFESYQGTSYSSSGVAPACWETGGTSNYTPHVVVSGSYAYVHSGTKSLSFCGTSNSNCYAALPIFADELNTLRVSLWAQMESTSNGTLSLGYITSTDPGDWSSYQVLENYTSSSTMTQHETYLDTIPAEAARLVIRWNYPGSSYYSCCIDDIKVSRIPTCLKPTDLAVVPGSVAKNSIQLTWEDTTPAEAWKIQYKKSGAADWTTIDADANPFEISGLEAFTTYSVRVASVCDPSDALDGTSEYSDEFSFKTAAGVPFAESFNSYSMPAGWNKGIGLWDIVASDPDSLLATSSGWLTSSTLNGVFPDSTYHLKLNIYGENCKYWLISPTIEVAANQQLTFDMALTKSSGSLSPVTVGEQNDDKFIVLLSADGGQSWEELYVRDNVSSADAFDQIACSATGEFVTIDLSSYAGENVQIAFYGESTVEGGDNYLHIANVSVDAIPLCDKPLELAVSEITAQTATFTWGAAEANSWVLQYSQNADFSDSIEVAVNEATYSAVGLTPETKYYVRVKAVCDGDAESAWSASVSFLPTDAKILTLYDGGETNSVIPIYGYWADNITQSQFIIPAADVLDLQWDTIVRLTFYTDEASVDLGDAEFEVYMGTTDKDAYESTLIDLASLTKVHNASTVVIADNEMVLELDVPYVYQEGNLVIAFMQTVSGSFAYTTWQGAATADYQSAGGYGTSSLNKYQFSPKVTFRSLEGEEPACMKPANIVADPAGIELHSILLAWENRSGESNWVLQYKKHADTEWTELAEPVTANPFTLEGLDAASVYDIRIAAWCDPADSATISDFTDAISVATACEVIAEYPWNENFDDVAVASSGRTLPVCWDAINTTEYESYQILPTLRANEAKAHSGENYLYFLSRYNSSTDYDPQDQYAILPEMEGINELRIKFWARMEDDTDEDLTLTIGVMTDPADVTTFVPVAAKSPATINYEQFVVPFDSYEGTGKYIAIKVDAATSSYRCAIIDDIVVEEIPSCMNPDSLQVALTEGDGTVAALSWVAGADEIAWVLQYSKNLDFSDSIEVAVNDLPAAALENLTPEATYYARVKAVCGVGDESPWTDPIAFVPTNAQPIAIISGRTTTNGYVPIYGYYADNYSYSQFIIPADSLAAIQWGYIKGLTFYAANANMAWGDAKFEVYVSPADAASFASSSLSAWDDMEKVMNEASLSIVDSLMVVTFDTPYQYEGGNLMIGIKQTVSGQWSSCSWRGISATNASVGGYGTSINRYSFLPKLTVSYVPGEAPACVKPTGLAISHITDNAAMATWDDIEDGAWKYAYALASEEMPAEFIAIANDTVEISGLVQNSDYIFYLRQDCGEDGLSEIISKPFRTKQSPVAVPFADDFENGNNWYLINGEAVNAWVVDTAAHNAGTHALYISNDNGVHNAYSNNKTALVYAAKAFSFEQGSYIFNYEWRANGENYSDYLRVALVPDSIDFEAGSISSTSLPTGWTALDGGSKLNLKTVWDTITTAEIPVAEGIYNVVFVWNNDGSLGSNPPAAIDNFSIAEVACPMQSNLVIPDSTKTDSSAKIFWKKGNADQDAWQIAFDTIARFVPDSTDSITILDVTTIPYELTGLVENKTYYVSVRAKCGENEFSKWTPRTSFKTAKSCQKPSGLAASQVSDTAAVISWNTFGQTEFNLRYGIGSNWLDTIENVTMPYTLNGLNANTSYRVQVQAQCDLTQWSSALTFKTACAAISALPWNEDFEAMTASTVPDCWDNSDSETSTVTSSPAYVWGVYGSDNKVLRMYNSYVQSGTALINSPHIELPAAPASEVSFDYANLANCGPFSLKVSADGGANWTELQQFANASGSSSTSVPSSFSEAVVDLSDYAGQSIMLQFYAEANFGNGAIFVDNVSIHAIPSCKKTSAPAIDSIAAHAALISWTLNDSLQTAWQIAYDTVALFVPDSAEFITILDVDTTSYLIEGLDAEKKYYVAVRANCGEGDYSVWSAVKSFTTDIACYAPKSLKAVLTPGDGSITTLNWTAGASETAWVLQYSENADFSDSIEVEINDAPTASLTALTPETKYYARVKAVCGGIDGESLWSAAISFVPTDALFITLNDSTATNSCVPVYGMWADNYSRSQFIIPEADLASIQWDSITQLTFYASQTNVSWGNAEFKVYMAEAPVDTIAELTDWSALRNVKAAGSLSIADGKMVVALDEPYQYQGGNLLLGFEQTESGSWVSSTWYGKTANGASLGGYGTSISQQNFLPKMTIIYVNGEMPACDAPTELSASDIFENEVTLNWTSDASAWQLVYSENADFDPNEATPLDVQKPYVLGNLLSQTTYYFYVRANCGHAGFSAWSAKGSFATAAPCVTKYAEIVYDSLCIGGSYTWQGKEYTLPDTYYDTLQTAAHCDSILTLVLDYYNAEDTIYDATQIAADELPFEYENEDHPYIEGQAAISYPAGTPLGIYYDTVLVVGEHCTAVLVHELTIERCEVEGETTEVELCPGEGYEWKGQIIGEAGTYYDTIPSAAGCDSIETLILSFYDPEDTIFIDLKIAKDSLPFTYVNEEHPYITGEAPLSYPEGTSIGLHHDTAYVEGEHCTAVLVLNLTIEDAQGIDNIFGRDGKGAQKVIYRDIMYIIINDEWYSAAGQKVDDPRK